MLKLYEEFVSYDKLYEIIKQLENRIKYWFTEEGTLGKDTNLSQIDATLTNKYSTRSIIINFSNENYMYQGIFTVSADRGDKCHIILKRYDLGDQNLIDKTEEEIDLQDVKEDYIIGKMSDMEGKSENPEDNEIEVQKEPEPEPQEDNGDQTQQEPADEEFGDFGGGGGDNFDLGGGGGGQEEIQEEEFEF